MQDVDSRQKTLQIPAKASKGPWHSFDDKVQTAIFTCPTLPWFEPEGFVGFFKLWKFILNFAVIPQKSSKMVGPGRAFSKRSFPQTNLPVICTKAAIAEAGAVPYLAALLKDPKAQVTAAGALRNLAAQNLANQERKPVELPVVLWLMWIWIWIDLEWFLRVYIYIISTCLLWNRICRPLFSIHDVVLFYV